MVTDKGQAARTQSCFGGECGWGRRPGTAPPGVNAGAADAAGRAGWGRPSTWTHTRSVMCVL